MGRDVAEWVAHLSHVSQETHHRRDACCCWERRILAWRHDLGCRPGRARAGVSLARPAAGRGAACRNDQKPARRAEASYNSIDFVGVDIRTAGTASVLISIPVVITGVTRHWLTGHYRSASMFQNLILPMALGSLIGALVGGYLAAWAPTDALRTVLAAILAVSAIKIWSKRVA